MNYPQRHMDESNNIEDSARTDRPRRHHEQTHRTDERRNHERSRDFPNSGRKGENRHQVFENTKNENRLQNDLDRIFQSDIDELEQFYKKYDQNADLLAVHKIEETGDDQSSLKNGPQSRLEYVRTSHSFDEKFDNEFDDDNLELPNDSIYLPVQQTEIKNLHPARESIQFEEEEKMPIFRESIDIPLNYSSTYIKMDQNREEEEMQNQLEERMQEQKNDFQYEHAAESLEGQIEKAYQSKTRFNKKQFDLKIDSHPDNQNENLRSRRRSEKKNILTSRASEEMNMNFSTENPKLQNVQPNEHPMANTLISITAFDEQPINAKYKNFDEQLKEALKREKPLDKKKYVQRENELNSKDVDIEENEQQIPVSKKKKIASHRYANKKNGDSDSGNLYNSQAKYESTLDHSQNNKHVEKSLCISRSQEHLNIQKPREKLNQSEFFPITDSIVEFERIEAVTKKKQVSKTPKKTIKTTMNVYKEKEVVDNAFLGNKQLELSEMESYLKTILVNKTNALNAEDLKDSSSDQLNLINETAKNLKRDIIEEFEQINEKTSKKMQRKVDELEKQMTNLEEQNAELKGQEIVLKEEIERSVKKIDGEKKETLLQKSKRIFEEENELLKKRIRKIEDDLKAKETKSKDQIFELTKKIQSLEQDLREKDKIVNVSARNVSPLKKSTRIIQTERHEDKSDRKSVSPIKSKVIKAPPKQETSQKVENSNQIGDENVKKNIESLTLSEIQKINEHSMNVSLEIIKPNENKKVYVSMRKDKPCTQEATNVFAVSINNVEISEKDSKETKQEQLRKNSEELSLQNAEQLSSKNNGVQKKEIISIGQKKESPAKRKMESPAKRKDESNAEKNHEDKNQMVKSPSQSKKETKTIDESMNRVVEGAKSQTEKQMAIPKKNSVTLKVMEKQGSSAVILTETEKTAQERKLFTSVCRSFTNIFPGTKQKAEPFNINEFAHTNNQYFKEYLKWNSGPKKITKTTNHTNEKVHNSYDNKVQEILFATGARRLIFPNNYIVVFFQNKDIKQTFPDNTVVYFYSEHDTTQMTIPGAQVEVN